MTSYSFLPDSNHILRNMISGIMESYENPWDVFAELAQNSIDAIHEKKPPKGHIKISVNSSNGNIQFSDNGSGIDPTQLKELFVPYGTNKRGEGNTIGEKGVGLKFVIFLTNEFKLISHHKNGSVVIRVNGAADWLNKSDDSEFLFESHKIKNDESKSGVSISLTLQEVSDEIFGLTIKQLRTVLITKTAIGSTSSIWGEEENSDVVLKVTDKSGKSEEIEFECKYLTPIDLVKKSISLEKYIEWTSNGDRSDAAKRRKLKDSIIYDLGTKFVAGREIKYWSCITPSRSQWAKIAVDSELLNPDLIEDFNAEDHFYAHSHGVYLSTKYMPTGVTIDLKATGEAGYTNNFFIIIEDPSLKFDIGRKGIPPRTTGTLRSIAREQFKKFLKYKRFIRGESETTNSQFEREKLFREIKKLPELKSEISRFTKRPNQQEATVAAIFYELMGKGFFEGFTPYVSGYRDKYDLTGQYNQNNLILEFKYNLTSLLNDFSTTTKMFDEINILILWEITEKDIKNANEKGIDIEPLEDEDDRIFPNTHQILTIDSVAPIEVVEIKKLLL